MFPFGYILLILEQKKKILKILSSIILFATILGVIVTGTRGALMGICIIFIIYMLSLKKKLNFLIMALIALFILIPLIPEHTLERIGEATSDQGSGRLSIWMVGLRSLEKYWLFGAGFENFPNAYNEFVDYWPVFRGLNRAPHNIFLEILVDLGIVGFALLIIALIKHYKVISSRFIQENSDQIMLKATFWGMLTDSFFINSLWLKPFWLLWMMILMYRMEEDFIKGKFN
jgi:O-antigen ligase